MLKEQDGKLIFHYDAEKLWIEPWGPNALRIWATKEAQMSPENWALTFRGEDSAKISAIEQGGEIVNGKIRATVSRLGKLMVYNSDGKLLLEEYSRNRRDVLDPKCSAIEVEAREFKPIPGGDYHLTMRFESLDSDEKIFGMGQYQQPHLNLKGLDLELAHRNSQASVPFALSSLGYGLLWNNPGVGRAVLGKNIMSFEAYSTRALDYWIVAGDTPAEIEEAYASVTGTVPMMPEYGLGFWQCKLRYQTQEELLEVAREYKRRGLPIDLIVIDFFHWPKQGEWKFDPVYWPDPDGMVRELKDMGIELGSTCIKAVAIDARQAPVSSGDCTWASSYKNGVWTYALDEVWKGLKAALSGVKDRENVCAMGVSAMMHGYLAFDADWNLLTPFRTWQNTITGPAASELTELFGFNIPQRWSIVHLYQAVLNEEEHVPQIAHITTLAGYVHYMLTGINAVGVGEVSGMFPIDSKVLDYDKGMLKKFSDLISNRNLPWKLADILPKVLPAGADSGCLTETGSIRLDGLLFPGIPFAPAEGDADTGMTATNAVAPRTGNVSAGTSIFSMVVLEKPLSRVYEEIDLVTTPTGAPVAMVHCNNCTGDTNAWANVFREMTELFGAAPDTGELYTRLYNKSLEGETDCSGVTVCNYLSGEGVTHVDVGRPLVVRTPESRFTLANFVRTQLYSTMTTLKIGMDILAREGVAIDSLTGHGGLFKTPLVGQKYLAAACGAPVTCMDTAGEGGPCGMALLAAYRMWKADGETLEDYLARRVFARVSGSTVQPDRKTVDGFNAYLERYKALLDVERKARWRCCRCWKN